MEERWLFQRRSWIRWSHQGSVDQSRATYATICTALLSPQAAYTHADPNVFLQGSYCNDTNIFAESDVDIVIATDTCFIRDLEGLPQEQQDAFWAAHPAGAVGDAREGVRGQAVAESAY